MSQKLRQGRRISPDFVDSWHHFACQEEHLFLFFMRIWTSKRFSFPVGYFSHIAHESLKRLGIAGQHCENWPILTYLLPTVSRAVTDGLVNGATYDGFA
jgi:hypothetical protein